MLGFIEESGLQTEAQLLKGVTSSYLYRGRKRLSLLRGYGFYATNDKLFGVRVIGIYRVLLLLSPAISTFALVGFIIILAGLAQNQPQPSVFQFPIWLLLFGLPMVAFLPRSLVEKRFKSFSQPRPDWIAEGRDFEATRDKISSIEFRWPGDLRVGHILVTTVSGPIKIWLAQPSRRGLVLELRDLLSTFCSQNPRIELVERV